MKRYGKIFLIICLCLAMIIRVFPVSASDGNNTERSTYMSSANVYATVVDGDDVIGRVIVPCLSKVAEIDVNMYLQRAYGTVWRNVTEAYNINVKDTNELDKSAIIYNVSPGTYRVYIEVAVFGYDGFFDSAEVGTGSFTIYT